MAATLASTRLRVRDGVRVTATLGYVDQPRRPYYTMTYTVHGDTHEARAFDNLDQFDGVEPGDRVAVLVDPGRS